ncbi:hypothetical protein D9M68_574400 [compost metagenome]
MRQQQQALGTEALGFLGVLDGQAGRAADAGEDRHGAGTGVDRGLDHRGVLVRCEGEEFTGSARGEERRGAVGSQPFQATGVGVGAKVAGSVEVGDGEGQQPGGEDGLEFLWIHYSSTLRSGLS